MRVNRSAVGVWASVLWFAFGISILLWSGLPSKPNEWGDYFAGIFAPLAFLWLVLGYLQQGEELRLQAEELRNSVEQQAEIARVARDQLEDARQAALVQDMERKRAARPDLRVSVDTRLGSIVGLKISNVGGAIRHLKWGHDAIPGNEAPLVDRLFEGDETYVHFIDYARPVNLFLRGVTAVDEVVWLKTVVSYVGVDHYAPSAFDPVPQAEWEEFFRPPSGA